MHPQTLLCYEMNGADLTSAPGAPLRLVIPVKYGVKNIKRIGKISYTNTRPRDFWAGGGIRPGTPGCRAFRLTSVSYSHSARLHSRKLLP